MLNIKILFNKYVFKNNKIRLNINHPFLVINIVPALSRIEEHKM